MELSALIGGVQTDLGAATLDGCGGWNFEDLVGAAKQSLITATETDKAGGVAVTDAGSSLQAGIASGAYVARQDNWDSVTGALESPISFARVARRVDGLRVPPAR